LRQVWEHDVSTSLDGGEYRALEFAGYGGAGGRRHVSALPKQLCRQHKILRALWNSNRNRIARLASAQARRSLLSNVQQQLSGRNEILRTLWKANYSLSPG